MMTSKNPFLDPDKEIQQGKSDEEILAEHERRQRQAAEDASDYRPGPRSVDEAAEGEGDGTDDGGGTGDDDILKYDGLNDWVTETVEEAIKKATEKRMEETEKWSDKVKKFWKEGGKWAPYRKYEKDEDGEYSSGGGPYGDVK